MSVWFDILSSAATELNNVGGLPPTSIRDTPILFQGESVPILLICPHLAEGEKVNRVIWNATAWWVYPLLCVYITAGNRLVDTGLQSYLTTRQTIRNTLFQPLLSGAAEVFDADIEPKAVADLQATLGSNYRVSGFLLRYKTSETRLNG